jgi:hypothetical protein
MRRALAESGQKLNAYISLHGRKRGRSPAPGAAHPRACRRRGGPLPEEHASATVAIGRPRKRLRARETPPSPNGFTLRSCSRANPPPIEKSKLLQERGDGAVSEARDSVSAVPFAPCDGVAGVAALVGDAGTGIDRHRLVAAVIFAQNLVACRPPRERDRDQESANRTDAHAPQYARTGCRLPGGRSGRRMEFASNRIIRAHQISLQKTGL